MIRFNVEMVQYAVLHMRRNYVKKDHPICLCEYAVLLLTCRSFSAVGLFFGFLVKASLTKWWKLFVLFVPQREEDRKEKRVNLLAS